MLPIPISVPFPDYIRALDSLLQPFGLKGGDVYDEPGLSIKGGYLTVTLPLAFANHVTLPYDLTTVSAGDVAEHAIRVRIPIEGMAQ